jgi:6-phosphogluconolactonase
VKIEVLPDADSVARQAAVWVAAEARSAVAERGRFGVAGSGGGTPGMMLRALAEQDVPWQGVHLFQVDERVAPAGDPDRNLTHLEESLLVRVALPASQVHAMPVEAADLLAAAGRYARTLEDVAGTPPALDLIHLGLGPDGHTASLVPGDPVLAVDDRDVALTSGPYQGRRRMTFTYPLLDRARKLLWLVTGASKVEMLQRLQSSDPTIPAGRVRGERATLLADRAAAGQA